MEIPEIHIKQTLFRRPMPDYRYLRPTPKKQKLKRSDMPEKFFFEKPIPKKYKCHRVSRYIPW